MIRIVIAATAILAFASAPRAFAQSAPWFPAPPPEFRLDEGPEQSDTRHRFNYDTLGWVEITGQGWRAAYVLRAGVGRPVLDVLRHYRDQINLRGGRRLLSLVGSDDDGRVNGGQMAAYFPGAPPLWLQVNADGDRIDVTLISEQRSEPVKLPVPPERTPGRWNQDAALPATISGADRVVVEGVRASLSRFFRDAPMLKTPVGFDASLTIEPAREAEVISLPGTRGYEFRLWLPETFQACDTCPAQHANEAGTYVHVRVNDLYRVLTATVDDASGQPLYEVKGEFDRSRPTTRLRGGTLVMTRRDAPSLWTPVTRKDYLEARIKDAKQRAGQGDRDVAAGLKAQEAALKDLEKVDPAMARQVRAQMAEALKQMPKAGADNPAVEQLTQELASLSDAQKAEPASGGDGTRIVRLNPAYPNRALPALAPQVVVVEFDRNQYFYYRDIVERMKQLDWAPVAALVK